MILMTSLLYPIATEKAVGMIDRDNIIVYMVDLRASKSDVKKEFENTFKVKIDRINMLATAKNQKKAYIRLTKAYKASDIALKLKLV